MEAIHLDPACDFVSTKSAESDGIDFDVAFKHYKECQRCRDYHALRVQKADLFGLTIKHTLETEMIAAKEQAAKKEEGIKDNSARLDLLMSYLGGTVEPVTVEYPYKHTDVGIPPLVKSVVRLNTEAGDYEVHVMVGSTGFYVKRSGAKGDADRFETAVQAIAALATAIGKHRYNKGRKK